MTSSRLFIRETTARDGSMLLVVTDIRWWWINVHEFDAGGLSTRIVRDVNGRVFEV